MLCGRMCLITNTNIGTPSITSRMYAVQGTNFAATIHTQFGIRADDACSVSHSAGKVDIHKHTRETKRLYIRFK